MRLCENYGCSFENAKLKNDSPNTMDIIEMIGHPNQRLPYNYTFAMYQSFPKLERLFLETKNNASNQCLPTMSPTTRIHCSRKLLPMAVVDSPCHFGGNCNVSEQCPRRLITMPLTQLQLPPQRPRK